MLKDRRKGEGEIMEGKEGWRDRRKGGRDGRKKRMNGKVMISRGEFFALND